MSYDEGDFFVMLNTQKGGITPLTHQDGELETFDMAIQARAAAESTVLGEMFGYEVFERGCGD